jgi:hypothetical protein
VKKPKKHLVGRRAHDGWYEIVDTAEDARRITSVKEAEGYRCFFRGPVGDVVIIEVPEDMPNDARDALGRSLSAQGVSVLLVTERIKFYRLRRARPDEEKKLNAHTQVENGEASASAPAEHEAPEDPLAGPLTDSDGAWSDRRNGSAHEERDAPLAGDEGKPDRVAP